MDMKISCIFCAGIRIRICVGDMSHMIAEKRIARSRGSKMPNEKDGELTDIERLHQWMEAVGGSLFPGESALKSVKNSKDGDKRPAVGAFI
jgi:hypothetical protein